MIYLTLNIGFGYESNFINVEMLNILIVNFDIYYSFILLEGLVVKLCV